MSLLPSIGDPAQAGKADATPVGRLCERIAEGDLEAASKMLQEVPNMALQVDRDGMTPLHWACDRGREDLVRLLLEMLGRDDPGAALALVNARDALGDTPLHFAVLTENAEIARLLLAGRADPQAVNGDGESPQALCGSSKEFQELLHQGAADS